MAVTTNRRWNDVVQEDREFRVVMKTKRALYVELESAIKENHPYTVPQIIGAHGQLRLAHAPMPVRKQPNGGFGRAGCGDRSDGHGVRKSCLLRDLLCSGSDR